MKTSGAFSIVRIAVPTLWIAAAAARIVAQSPTPKFEPPRLKDGHPDLQGLWKTSGGFGPPEPNVPRPPAFDYLPAAAAEKQELVRTAQSQDIVANCITASVPREILEPPYPMLLVQDGTNGDSRGHWEGDTLVVDVTGFSKGIRWLHMGGDFVDENEHAVERFTLIDPNTILYDLTIEDPTVLAKPWNAKLRLLRQPKNDQILEGSCREGERDVQHYVVDGAK